jgi:hypothetical protein
VWFHQSNQDSCSTDHKSGGDLLNLNPPLIRPGDTGGTVARLQAALDDTAQDMVEFAGGKIDEVFKEGSTSSHHHRERVGLPHDCRCKSCQYIKHFTRPVALEAAG